MDYYGYDENGYYTGIVQGQPDPLNPPQYLQPSNCTATAPPTTTVTFYDTGYDDLDKWNGSSWETVEHPWKTEQDLKAEASKYIVYFRDNGTDDERVEGYSFKNFAWPDFPASEPNGPNDLPMSDPSNSDLGYIEVADSAAAIDAISKTTWSSADKKVVSGSVVSRLQSDIDADDATSAWTSLREERDVKIVEVEWYRSRHKDEIDQGLIVGTSTSLNQAEYDELLTYIQELRDFPNTVSDPTDTLTWPTKPSWAS